MSILTRFAACVAIPLLAVGCNSVDRQLFREGVGTDLYWSGLPQATQLQDIYVGLICRQAGLPVLQIGDAVACDYTAIRSSEWSLFVQAGMNDIDLRCDNYLTWLDSKRRSSGPIHQQILDTQNAAAAILVATEAGAKAIALVGTAFGFAAHTFTNINSRLLFELDQSTVQTVVLTRQNQFRLALPTSIDNRAAAIYALRSYLRLCLPMTIETQVNTTVKLFERGGLEALADSQARPMIDPRIVRSAIIRDATVPMSRPAKAPRVVLPTRFGSFEESLTTRDIEAFQRAVCVTPSGDLGPLRSETRLAIQRALGASDETLTDRKGILLRRKLRAGVTC
jgi:hypothetical protein